MMMSDNEPSGGEGAVMESVHEICVIEELVLGPVAWLGDIIF